MNIKILIKLNYMDSFYCLVRIVLHEKIALYCIVKKDNFNYWNKSSIYLYPTCFTANSTNNIIKLLSLHDFFSISSFEHALYLGKELYKAEIALIFKQIYIQE
uniref:DUF4346 domain-containing protein n=1 Tax=Antithamnion hubbsii TaxID=1005974 RepID=A0A4D6WLP2_9FLOR|nr:hypothetical protein [Antithamnion hubbsii]